MNTTIDLSILDQEIRSRFGAAKADLWSPAFKQALHSSNPDYMVVKTASEMLELLREEARFALAVYRLGGLGSHTALALRFAAYRAASQLYYRLYARAIAACEAKIAQPCGANPAFNRARVA